MPVILAARDEARGLEIFFFGDLHLLARKLASPFGLPTQLSTQVQLDSTCDYLGVRLAEPGLYAFHFGNKIADKLTSHEVPSLFIFNRS